MKSTITLFLLLLFSATSLYAQDWVTTDITEFASIKFPVTSELIETQRETVYTAQDEFGYYIVSLRKLTEQESSQITKKDLSTIYQGVAQGAIDAANAKLVSMNEIYIEKIPAVEMEYTAPANPELPSQRFKRILYLNQTIITMDFWPLTNQAAVTNEQKLKYFDSFTINSAESSESSTSQDNQNTTTSTSYEAGFIMGQILFYLFLLAFVIGIVFLIRYLIRKSRKNKTQVNTKEKPRTQQTKILCQNCHSENKSDSKYCSSCGYELKKI